MRKTGSILFSLMFLACVARAQKKDGGNKFSARASIGMLEGQAGTSFLVETSGGFRYKSWLVGIGAGLDYYSIRSVPVFLTATRYLSKKNNIFFVQTDAGLNFGWQNKQISRWSNEISNKFSPGMYWNGTVGFVTGLNKKNSFVFGLGYSYKFLKETKEVTTFCFNPPCENSFEIYRYNLRRLSLRLGWQFNQ